MLAYVATAATLMVLAAMMWCYDAVPEFRHHLKTSLRFLAYLPLFAVTATIGAMRPKGYEGRHCA